MLRSMTAIGFVIAALVSAAQAADTFPVTVRTALGEAVIPAKPERIVVWGWSAQDVVLDLGTVPVGMPFFRYGGGDDGILPWTADALAEMGGEAPTILPEAAEPPVEAIAALQPDLILAPYSGLSQAEFDTLSGIAPVVGFPTEPWFASWQQVVELTGAAMGESEAAAQLIADTQASMQQQIDAYPELQGLRFANIINRNDGQVSVRMALDPRVALLTDLGMVAAPVVSGIEVPADTFFYPLSYENLDQLDAELLIAFFDNQEASDAFFALPYISSTPLVADGAVAVISGEELTMAVSGAVTPMSLRWGFAQYIDVVGNAVP